MFDLPLFPLRAVLFPSTPLQLHIFEARYQLMINSCIHDQRPFGVALIRRGVEARGALAEPHAIGCSAQIIHVEHLQEGRMNIVALGVQRFRLLSVDRQARPYLMGKAEEYPLEDPDPDETQRQAWELRDQVLRFVSRLMQAGGEQIDLQQIPTNPVALAYMAAALLQVSALEKQELLTLPRADALIERLRVVYRREISLLKAILVGGGAVEEESFSKN